MKRLLLSATMLLALAACSAERDSTATRTTVEVVPPNLLAESSPTETAAATGRHHGYLRRLSRRQGRYYATLDYVQFLTGAAAVAAARQRGDAAIDIQGTDTTYSVFNDYYLLNDDARVLTLPLSPTATFQRWRPGPNGLEQYTLSPAELLAARPRQLPPVPFIIETRRDTIVGFTEQYVP